MKRLSRHRRAVRSLPVLLALALFGSGCAAFDDSSTAQDGSGSTITVATAFYPLQWATQQIAGDRATVVNLTKPGQEPHDLELTVKETADITDADLVVYETDLQPGVADSVEENATGETLDVGDVVTLQQESHDGHDHGDDDTSSSAESEEEHDHGGVDPHFWQDPLLLDQVAQAIAERLAKIAPDDADLFEANAAKLSDELSTLDASYTSGLTGCQRNAVVVSHDAFGYLGRYGLDFYPIVGLSPEAEPTPADLGRLQDLIRTQGITTVFGETLVSPRIAETLASDMGVRAAVLDPIEGLSDQTSDQDYLSLMQQNLTALEEANGCP